MAAPLILEVYRYLPEQDASPRMQAFSIPAEAVRNDWMVRDALIWVQEHLDSTLTFRHSCGEGVCGSDGLHINGRNQLACITRIAELNSPISIRPLPGMPVVRDLVVDMEGFWAGYREVEPWLQSSHPQTEREQRQSPEQREALDGLYECILCGCCTAACPSWWWNPDQYPGPAALLAATRFVVDSRDDRSMERLDALDDPMKLFRCHSIMSCTQVCPKGLNPARAIGELRSRLLKGR
jgi:succinate dehydrogenase / fumarate reductase iron-sulfur subunit